MVGFCGNPPFRSSRRMPSLRALPAFSDNYIWILANASGEAIVVDPGDAGPVLAEVERGLKPVAILLTHHHPDHVGGAGELLERFDIPCYAPHDERIRHATHRVGEGDRVRVEALGLDFDVVEIPGHTLTHIAFHGGGWLFCGDTLFSLGCGRMFEGSPEQMLASLERLASLPGGTLVCCGHEYTEANGRFATAAEPQNPARDARLAEVARMRAEGRPSARSLATSARRASRAGFCGSAAVAKRPLASVYSWPQQTSVPPGSEARRSSDASICSGLPSNMRPQPRLKSVSPQNSQPPPWKAMWVRVWPGISTTCSSRSSASTRKRSPSPTRWVAWRMRSSCGA